MVDEKNIIFGSAFSLEGIYLGFDIVLASQSKMPRLLEMMVLVSNGQRILRHIYFCPGENAADLIRVEFLLLVFSLTRRQSDARNTNM